MKALGESFAIALCAAAAPPAALLLLDFYRQAACYLFGVSCTHIPLIWWGL